MPQPPRGVDLEDLAGDEGPLDVERAGLVLSLYDSVIFSGVGSSETATLPSIIRESC